MRINWLMTLVTGLMLVGPAGAAAEKSVRVRIDMGTAPPPPVVTYRETPETIVVPNTTVHVVKGKKHKFDYFHYGVYWYIHNDGHWYRARKFRGPFTVVEMKYVPRAIITVPAKFWRQPRGAEARAKS